MNVVQQARRALSKAKQKLVAIPSDALGINQVEQFAQYIDRPVEFCEEVLHVELIAKQQEAIRSLLIPPYRTLCPSGNSLGKSHMAACCVL